VPVTGSQERYQAALDENQPRWMEQTVAASRPVRHDLPGSVLQSRIFHLRPCRSLPSDALIRA
jgi:hypothetical protein